MFRDLFKFDVQTLNIAVSFTVRVVLSVLSMSCIYIQLDTFNVTSYFSLIFKMWHPMV